ncbi:MAG TPA: LPS-assembly protein LptD [Burkholderiaceae bacterium]|nr:LPS-assembly protein LptD [Burkholderiaceae bacterium]
MRRPLAVPGLVPLAAALATAFAAGSAVAQPSARGVPGSALRLETELQAGNLDADAPRPTFARGERIDGRTGRETTLEGGAEIRRGGTVVRGDRLTLYEADDEVVAVGDVRVAREGQVFTGPQLRLRLDANEGTFESPSFLLPLTGGRGSAERIDFLGRGRVALTRAWYTTCRPDDPDWYLKAERLTIDRNLDEGEARSATLYFMDVPVLASPYFGFALGDERRSGFLPPTLSATSTTGGEVRLPFYWNIAPNRDLTAYTNVSGRRGLQLGGIARYLGDTYSGTTTFEYNPQDLEARRERWAFNSLHNDLDVAGWALGWQLRGVSDDRYFIDYSRNILQSADRSLPRNVLATRGFGTWTVAAQVLQYQNILEARAAPPFDRLPQVTVTNALRDLYGFDVNFRADAVAFSRDLPGSAEGARLIANPSIAYPIGGSSWFVTPRASLHATSYRLNANPFGERDIDRVVPTLSIDSGLVFERDATLGGRAVTQTLEPRLFYVNTPFRDQSRIPVFDAGVANFNLATLFSENTFVGGDRIADANQLTAGAVSRFIDPATGIESLRLAVAQRLYFDDQRVTIPGVPTRTDARSDLLLGAAGDLGGGHSVDAAIQVSVADGSVPRAGVSWRYWPSADRILNVALRYQERDYAQIDTSWRWPVSARWSTLGRINYSVLTEGINPVTQQLGPLSPQLLEGVLGFEYAADCWLTRVVFQRFVTATQQRTSAVFVQLELGGLARIGLDPFDILVRNIPGYRPPSQRPVTPSRFYGYE